MQVFALKVPSIERERLRLCVAVSRPQTKPEAMGVYEHQVLIDFFVRSVGRPMLRKDRNDAEPIEDAFI